MRRHNRGQSLPNADNAVRHEKCHRSLLKSYDRGSLSRIEIIKEMEIPTSVKGVKHVLGKAGFYRRHIENFAMVVEPLLQLTRQGNKCFNSRASRTLSVSERKWPAVQVELSAIVYALREFRPFIFMSDVETTY
uniref:RT_RNaseH_2 domain-containing protein n=1 Tax=Globodera pallida TaxID=36090 RepID=A0A183BN85_GLOPA